VADDLDGILTMENNKMKLLLQNDDPTRAKGLQVKMNQAVSSSKFESKLGFEKSTEMLEVSYIYGDEDTVFFDVLSPIQIGFFVFFFVFLISGIGFLKERKSGTLEKLMSTPILRGRNCHSLPHPVWYIRNYSNHYRCFVFCHCLGCCSCWIDLECNLNQFNPSVGGFIFRYASFRICCI
jgi:hypothetical protein